MMRIRRYLALGARCVGGARALSWQAAGKGPKVSGAASASLKDGRVLLWGGLDEARNAVDGLYAFEDGAWTPVETTGFKPQKAMYAAAATQSLVGTSGKEEFVVCGGWDPGEKGSGGSFSDAVHALDVNKLEWQKDDPLPCGPVSRHAAATVGGSAEGRIYIHAFRDGVVRRDACGIAKSHKTTGQGPESLSMCAVAPVGDAGLLVVGGATKNGEFSDRAYVLDCVKTNQCVGCTRQFFTKSFLGDDAAVLARLSGEEPASPRHRAGVASMAWRTTRRFSTNAP